MRKRIVWLLLTALNSRYLNQSPCKYEFVGNIDAFSYEDLASSDKQTPGITVREYLDAADRFRSCPINKNGVTVIEADGTTHEADVWDIQQLRNLGKRSQ